MNSAWRRTWQEDLQAVLGAMHPRARRRFDNMGPCWPLARGMFYMAALRVGFDICYAAYVLEQLELLELTRELPEA